MDTRSESSLNTTLVRHLECPICFERCVPPIFVCHNGHNVCANCQQKLTECAICRCPKPTGRNLFAEALSFKLQNPPKVSCWARVEDGATCSWRGTVGVLGDHVASCHPRRISRGDVTKISWRFNRHVLNHRISLVETQDSLFWIVFCVWPSNSIVYATVRCIRSGCNVDFRYHLRFSTAGGEQTLHFASEVADLKERGDETHRALRLHSEVLQTFAEGGRLRCEVEIEGKE